MKPQDELRWKNRFRGLLQTLRVITPALVSRPIHERTQYKHPARVRKTKGGTPPIDYTVVELARDLELAIRRAEGELGEGENPIADAIPLYFQIKRIMNI